MGEHKENQLLHPEVEKILNFEIPARKIRADLLPENGEGILLGDMIDVSDIRFDERTGKPMMLHGGILSICDGIGVEFLPPTIEKTGDKEYQATVGIKLGDGTVFYATGEASQLNTDNRELSGKFPVNQTHIRALNKAVVRGLGLYRVLLTEEEADEFKTPQVQKLQQDFEAKLKEIVAKSQNKEERFIKVIAGLMDLVALPETDAKYPLRYIADIQQDVDYMEELSRGENKIVGFVANQLLKEQQKQSMKQEETIVTEVPVNEQDQDAFLKELKEGQEVLKKELEQAQQEVTATLAPAAKEEIAEELMGELTEELLLKKQIEEPTSVQLELDDAGNVIEPNH